MHSTADLPLHFGSAPKWLFERMVKLSGEITEITIEEFGTRHFLQRLSNPFWFQSLSCTIGFDWHSSGTTTTSCGAIKEALKERDLGLFVAGGKGKTARQTPSEIKKISESISLNNTKTNVLLHASKAAAKVDSAALQDGFDLYHHCIFFDEHAHWAIVQQGLNAEIKYARRYHWLGETITDFVEEPHSAICCDAQARNVLDLTARQSRENKKCSLDLATERTEKLQRLVNETFVSNQRSLLNWQRSVSKLALFMPRSINWKALQRAYEFQPRNFEEFLCLKGIGKNTVRALALVSELIYGNEASWKDPVKYSFAHGGKDGVPREINCSEYDATIAFMEDALKQTSLENWEKKKALERLRTIVPRSYNFPA